MDGVIKAGVIATLFWAVVGMLVIGASGVLSGLVRKH